MSEEKNKKLENIATEKLQMNLRENNNNNNKQQIISELQDNFKVSDIRIIQDPKGGGLGRKKSISRNNCQTFPKFNYIYKLTDARSSMNPKHKKHGEKYTKSQSDQTDDENQ